MNVVSEYKSKSIEDLLEKGIGLREITRRLMVDRSTVRRIVRQRSKPPTPATGSEEQNGAKPPTRPPGNRGEKHGAESACAPYQEWIEAQVDLGRNVVAIYQELVEQHGFAHRYNSVKRYVRKLRTKAPERFDFLEYGPGEEAQVDYGEGAPTLLPNGKYKKPYLFVMTLKYSQASRFGR